jgi:hypothetical protein
MIDKNNYLIPIYVVLSHVLISNSIKQNIPEKLLLVQLGLKSPAFMGLESPPPCSQRLSTAPYPKSTESGPHPDILLL